MVERPGELVEVEVDDDLPLAVSAVPRITTVRQDIARGANEMVSALFRRIAGEDAPSVVMKPILVERDSA